MLSVQSTEQVITPKHAAGDGTSPQSAMKLPAPSKRELLKAMTEQQQLLSRLLLAKQQRENVKPSGSLYAASACMLSTVVLILRVRLLKCYQVM